MLNTITFQTAGQVVQTFFSNLWAYISENALLAMKWVTVTPYALEAIATVGTLSLFYLVYSYSTKKRSEKPTKEKIVVSNEKRTKPINSEKPAPVALTKDTTEKLEPTVANNTVLTSIQESLKKIQKEVSDTQGTLSNLQQSLSATTEVAPLENTTVCIYEEADIRSFWKGLEIHPLENGYALWENSSQHPVTRVRPSSTQAGLSLNTKITAEFCQMLSKDFSHTSLYLRYNTNTVVPVANLEDACSNTIIGFSFTPRQVEGDIPSWYQQHPSSPLIKSMVDWVNRFLTNTQIVKGQERMAHVVQNLMVRLTELGSLRTASQTQLNRLADLLEKTVHECMPSSEALKEKMFHWNALAGQHQLESSRMTLGESTLSVDSTAPLNEQLYSQAQEIALRTLTNNTHPLVYLLRHRDTFIETQGVENNSTQYNTRVQTWIDAQEVASSQGEFNGGISNTSSPKRPVSSTEKDDAPTPVGTSTPKTTRRS